MMIKRVVTTALTIGMLSLVSTAACADQWKQYSEIMDRYYHLDTQAFTRISCKVEAQPISGFVSQLRQQFSKMTDDLRMTDTLDSYTLVFDRTTGLSFNDPTLNIEVLSEKGMADPSRVRLGIQQVIHGFDGQVQGLDNQMKGLFEDYSSPKQTDMTITKITQDRDGAVIEFKKDAATGTDTIRGLAVHSVQSDPSMALTADSTYSKASDGKLILGKFSMQMKQPIQTTTIDEAMTYQTIEGILFPETIDAHAVISGAAGTQTSMVITVKLSGCKIVK